MGNNPGGSYNPLFIYGGAGLGLFITRQIATMFGGTLTLSRAWPQGTRAVLEVKPVLGIQAEGLTLNELTRLFIAAGAKAMA